MQPVSGPHVPRASREEGADALHRHVLRARTISERMVGLQREGRIGFHTSAIGVEAAIVGAVLAVEDRDWVFPDARGWYAALARGLPIATYVHHAFGSAHDPAKGHAAPDHAPARAVHVVPPSGVVGAHLPQAVGAAWAARIRKDPVATLALFDAEVTASGDFHNALNFAGVFGVPTIFVCRAAPGAAIAEKAVAYGLASVTVPCRVDEVHAAVREARARAGATLVEVVGSDDGVHDDAALVAATQAELDAAIAAAEAAGPPARGSIFDDVYAAPPAALAAQRRSLGGGDIRG